MHTPKVPSHTGSTKPHRQGASSPVPACSEPGDHGYLSAIAAAHLEAQKVHRQSSKLATAMRYLEPSLVPIAATVWLYNLLLIVR